MAKRVFFSFHYDDVKAFRANVVRNHGYLKGNQEAGFFDASIWEDAKTHGPACVKKLIDNNLTNTTVTCVLIGSSTWSRRWVRYEIMKSYDRGNALMGIHINSVKDKNQQTHAKGASPFDYLGFDINADGGRRYQDHDGTKWNAYGDLTSSAMTYDAKWRNKGYKLGNWVPTYDWVADNGYNNFGTWVEKVTA
jgi:hypothetical protein